MEGCVFCPNCNFAVAKDAVKYARFDYSCPNCKLSTLSKFYSIGSHYHKELIKGNIVQLVANMKRIPPLPDDKK